MASKFMMDLCATDLPGLASMCHKSLDNLNSLMRSEWAENRLADFNLWAANFGLHAKKRAALDDRILRDGDNEQLIFNVLHLLYICIEACHKQAEIAKEPMTDSSVVAGSHSPARETRAPTPGLLEPPAWGKVESCVAEERTFASEELESAQQDVRESIEQLVQVSDTIRNNGLKSRFWEADRLFDPKNYVELKKHLGKSLKSRDSSLCLVKVDTSSKVTSCQRRIIMGNLKRRNRFLYCQKYSQQAHMETSEDWEDDETELPETFPRSTMDTPPATPAHSSEESEGRHGAQTKLPSLDHHPLSSPPESSYPMPPRVNGSQSFKCPFCCMILPSMYQEPTLWKDHLKDDIRPYTCFIDACPCPEVLYMCRSDWMDHIQKEHDQCWECLLCSDPKKLQVFTTVKSFVQHVKREHKNTVPEELSECNLITFAKQRPAPLGVSQCPLCDYKAAKGESDSEKLLEHIAEHIHKFSLESLPHRYPLNDLKRVFGKKDSANAASKHSLEDSQLDDSDTDLVMDDQEDNHRYGSDESTRGKRRKIQETEVDNLRHSYNPYE